MIIRDLEYLLESLEDCNSESLVAYLQAMVSTVTSNYSTRLDRECGYIKTSVRFFQTAVEA